MGRRLMADFLSGDKSYNVLFDRNVEHLAPHFPKKRVKTASQEGLPPSASDRDIVQRAWLRQSIIVTGDIKDFRPADGAVQETQGRQMVPLPLRPRRPPERPRDAEAALEEPPERSSSTTSSRRREADHVEASSLAQLHGPGEEVGKPPGDGVGAFRSVRRTRRASKCGMPSGARG